MIIRDGDNSWSAHHSDRSGRILDPLSLPLDELAGHSALFYESRDEQLAAASAYAAAALTDGYRCLYITDENTVSEVEGVLRTTDVAVDARLEGGDLRLRRAEEVYLDEQFDSDRIVESLVEAAYESVEDGYEGFVAIGENTWCFETGVEFDEILSFERDFDRRCPEVDAPLYTLCQYSLDRFSINELAKALWTHRQIIYRGQICQNPFYIPPEQYADLGDEPINVRLMLEQMYELQQARTQVARRDRLLSIVNRVLRHNIRNDLNVILANLELVLTDGELSPESKARLQTAREHANGVVETAEKARYLKRVVEDEPAEQRPLAAVVEDAADRVDVSYPQADITVISDVEEEIVVLDENLPVAVAEVVTTALSQQDSDQPSVEIDVTMPSAGSATVVIRAPEAFVSDPDQAALNKGRETPLEHGTGLGLWVGQWIVEQSGGTLNLGDDGGRSAVRLELPRSGKTTFSTSDLGTN